MLLRNLAAQNGDCNGSRYIVKRLGANIVVVTTFDGSRTLIVPRIDCDTSDWGLPMTMRRLKFPLRVAFAATISKAQGATLEQIEIWLQEPVFGHGQVYVGASSVGDSRVLHFGARESAYDESRRIFTNNVVYTQLLSD